MCESVDQVPNLLGVYTLLQEIESDFNPFNSAHDLLSISFESASFFEVSWTFDKSSACN